MKRIAPLLLLLLSFASLSPALMRPASAQSLPLLQTYSYTGNISASATPGSTVVGAGNVDVFGGRLSVVNGALVIASEGSLSFYRDFDYFSAAAPSIAQKEVVRSVVGNNGSVVAGMNYDPATKDFYYVSFAPGNNQIQTFRTNGNPASSYTNGSNSTIPAAAWNSAHQYQLVVSSAVSGGSKVITAAWFDLTTPGTSQPVDPVNVTDAGALTAVTWTDTTPIAGTSFATSSDYGGTSALSTIRLYGDSAGAAPSPSLALPVLGAVSDTTVALSTPATQNTTGAVAYELHRSLTSAFAPSAGDLVAGPQAGLTFSDAPPASVAPYYYKIKAVDSAATPNVLTSGQVSTVLRSAPASVVIAFAGNSRTYGSGASGALGNANVIPAGTAVLSPGSMPADVAQILSGQAGLHNVTVYDHGQVGCVASDWASGGAFMSAALAAFPAGCPVYYVNGTNDAKGPTPNTKAAYKANMLNTVNAFVAGGHPVYLGYDFPVVPGSYNGAWTESSNEAIRQYNQAVSEIVAADATGQVRLGDTSVFNFVSANNGLTWLTDGVHGTDKFYAWWGAAVARVLAPAFNLAPAPFSASRGQIRRGR